MIYSTTQNKFKRITYKILKTVLVASFWILVWEAVACFVSRDNELMLLLLPRPITVFEKWLEIGFTAEYLHAVGETLARIFTGFIIGLLAGCVCGLLTYSLSIANTVLSPIIKVIRAVPVAAITILFFSLFNSDALPVCIVALIVIPLIWQTVHDGLSTAKIKTLEMARVFRLSPAKTFYYVRVPALLPSLLTATVNALGLAWKSGVAAEIICEPNIALGTLLMQGKGMVDFSTVYAITLTVVILSLLIEFLLKNLCKNFVEKRRSDI